MLCRKKGGGISYITYHGVPIHISSLLLAILVLWGRKRPYTLLIYLSLHNAAKPGSSEHLCASRERLLCKPRQAWPILMQNSRRIVLKFKPGLKF